MPSTQTDLVNLDPEHGVVSPKESWPPDYTGTLGPGLHLTNPVSVDYLTLGLP